MSSTAPLIDCYILLGIERSSDEASIRKAYRRRALELHPDKNPDNPKAEELFLAVKAASDTLLDKSLRAALDARLSARDAAAARVDAMDSRRARMRSELEAREKAAADSAKRADSGARELSNRIERLRQEGRVRQEAFEEAAKGHGRQTLDEKKHQEDEEEVEEDYSLEEISQRCAVKLSWTQDINSRLGDETIPAESINTISENRLRAIFKLYGSISSVVARRAAARTACIIFASADSAEAAIAVPPDGFLISRIAVDTNFKTASQQQQQQRDSNHNNGPGKRRRYEVEEGDPSSMDHQASVPANLQNEAINNSVKQNGKQQSVSFLDREAQVLLKLKQAAALQSQKKR